jgi:hypothetical protein
VEGRKELDWGLSWLGTGLDGRRWGRRRPTVIADARAALLEQASLAQNALA